MSVKKRQPETISRLILEQYMQIDMCGEVDMTDFVAVRRYANRNHLVRLAGWLSWNGEDFYDVLVAVFEKQFGRGFEDVVFETPPPTPPRKQGGEKKTEPSKQGGARKKAKSKPKKVKAKPKPVHKLEKSPPEAVVYPAVPYPERGRAEYHSRVLRTKIRPYGGEEV